MLPINKVVTIPRAELQAAVLSSKIATILKTDLALDSGNDGIFWTDSEIVFLGMKEVKSQALILSNHR